MRRITVILCFILMLSVFDGYSDDEREIELTAQAIVARVDRVLDYPAGRIEGNIRHIFPDGESYTLRVEASVDSEDSLFLFGSRNRGDQIKVLYKLDGEDIWVYNILELKLFNKTGIDRFDPILATNFFYIDLSNADLQANYTAELEGDAIIKGEEVYRLSLSPIFRGGRYGRLTLYVEKENYIPVRIDFHDTDGVIFKFMTVSNIMENNGRLFPARYDMLDIRKGTISILTFNSIDDKVRFNPEIFRSSRLGE